MFKGKVGISGRKRDDMQKRTLTFLRLLKAEDPGRKVSSIAPALRAAKVAFTFSAPGLAFSCYTWNREASAAIRHGCSPGCSCLSFVQEAPSGGGRSNFLAETRPLIWLCLSGHANDLFCIKLHTGNGCGARE